MSPAPSDSVYIRLAIGYALIQWILALWMPDALLLHRILAVMAPAAAFAYLIRVIGRADTAMYAAKERNARWHFDVEQTMLRQLLHKKAD